MKILFVVPYVPNLIHVRAYNLIRALNRRGHRVSVAALATDDAEMNDVEAVKPFCQDIFALPASRWRSWLNSAAALPTKTPLQAVYSWMPAFARRLNELAQREKFDMVHVEHLRGVHYGLALKKTIPALPVVWDSVDCISLLFKQAAARSQGFFGRRLTRLELGRTQRYEAWLIRQFSHVLVTSPMDRAALLALPHPKRAESEICVIPNGVDLDYFQPGPQNARAKATLVISGKMSYHANVSMTLNLVRNILPLVWATHPEVRVNVVGKDPPAEILSLAQDARIQVTGTVPDLRLYLQQATIAVAPVTYGVGIQNKVLEAMACGAPVVSTPQAVSALQAVVDQDLLIGEDPETLAGSILQLLNDPGLRTRVGQAGREYVETHHRWDRIADRLVDVYEQAIEIPKVKPI